MGAGGMVMRTELAAALEQVIDAILDASVGPLVVTHAEIELPLEVVAGTRRGEVVFFGSAPHTRWVSGVLPAVHVAKLCVGLATAEARCGR
jgi:hypothetical protein